MHTELEKRLQHAKRTREVLLHQQQWQRQPQLPCTMQQQELVAAPVLHNGGGQFVVHMQQLREDVAARCQHVEQSAREDVRRSSEIGVAAVRPTSTAPSAQGA